MGILHLKSFIELDQNKQQVCVSVNLQEIADQWRESGGTAVIVADGHNISRKFKSDFEYVSGGEYKSIVQHIQEFIHAFRAISVDVVFFVGGGYDDMTTMTECKKLERMKTKCEIQEIFNGIEETPLRDQASKYVPCLFKELVKYATKTFGQCVRVAADRDKRMVQYVVENRCLGILSDDTDLFVYDGVPHIFSRNDLKIENLPMITEYRRETLLNILGLPGQAMPIFSTLMGNNVIAYKDTMDYHNWLFGKGANRQPGYVTEKAMTLAKLAREINEHSRGDLQTKASLLARKMFEQKDRQVQMDRIVQSLLVYDTVSTDEPELVELTDQSSWEDILEYCKQNYATFPHGRMSVAVMERHIFPSTRVLESSDKTLCVSEIFAEQRRRIYSVLLAEKNNGDGETEVKEFFGSGCRSPREAYPVSTIPVDVEHPGLYRLWFGDESLDNTRWNILLWILSTSECDLISNDLPVSVLKQPVYRRHFGFVTLVLFYLYKVVQKLTEKDLQVLMVMTACIPTLTASELDEFPVERISKRSVSVSSLFQYTCYQMHWVVKLCNIKLEFTMWDLYSGIFFHYLFQQDIPTAFLDELPPEAGAWSNYIALKTALDEFLAE